MRFGAMRGAGNGNARRCRRGLRAAELRAGRGVPVRLEPRDRADQRRDGDGEGRPCPALPQPDAVRAGLPARDARRWCSTPTTGRSPSSRAPAARHLRQHRFLQMCSHYLIEPVACTPAAGWEKGQVENQVGQRARALLHAPAAGQELRGAERLAARPVHRLRQGASPSRSSGPDDLGGVRGGAGEPGALCRAVRRLPCGAGVGLQDLPGALRQQQVLGLAAPSGRPVEVACLCRPHRRPPGRPDRWPSIRAQFGRGETIYDPWHYRAGARPQARRPCAMAPPSRTGCCRPPWSACGASSPAPTTAIGRWSTSSPRCSTDGLPAVEAACAEALEHGVHSADVILNILARQRDPGPPRPSSPPRADAAQPPIADCARYDSLRRASDGTPSCSNS
jgi:hypothetical protein